PSGVVYRCERARRPFALKAMHRELSRPRAAAALAIDLGRLGARGCRHVAPLLDSGFTDEQQLYLVTPELRGVDLADALAERGPCGASRKTRRRRSPASMRRCAISSCARSPSRPLPATRR